VTLFSPLIDQLITALRCLPGVGPKTAQRMTFHLLERNRNGGVALAKVLEKAMQEIKHCRSCRMLCETDDCELCKNSQRDRALMCIVESPADVMAIEQTASYRGLYFVLMGHLSPLDGIGPDEIGVQQLLDRLAHEPVREVILATNPTVEGEATAYYIGSLLKERKIHATRIAHGVPLGGELEYLDGGTLWRALQGRLPLHDA
jgi:recombination protein RecR